MFFPRCAHAMLAKSILYSREKQKMLLAKEKVQHINSIAHEGKVVVVATDTDGKIWYTVKQDGFEDSYLNTPEDQRTGWEKWQELKLPNEADDRSVLDKEAEEFTYKNGNANVYLLKSLYKTHEQSASAPVQLVSGLGHLYIFRQSKTNILLVDRFVLDGLTNTLTRKLEVRFKRSKQKHKPSKTQKKSAHGLTNIDSLDYTDINGNNFYEPTTELSLLNNLANGWFSVVLLPTNEQDKYRWHIFAYNSTSKKVELTTLRASEEGLFDVRDYTILDPEPRSIAGIIKRTLNLGTLTVAKGLTATKYDLQRERLTDEGMQLLRDSVRVMLVVGTGAGNVAAISFAVAADGTLSEIEDDPDNTTIRRSNTRQILLPLNTLDQIKTIGTTNPPPQGTITGIARGEDDKVILTSATATGLDETEITEVKITGNQDYNRLYSQVTKIDDNTFEISHESSHGGNWEVIPEEETGLIFNGIVTAYEITSQGKLKVTALNHGLNNGDSVQVVDSKDYNGTYTVTKVGDNTFSLDGVRWQAGTAISANIQTQKRRGVILDGDGDYIELPLTGKVLSSDFTVEAWIKPSVVTGYKTVLGTDTASNNQGLHLTLYTNKLHFGFYGNDTPSTTNLTANTWYHVAFCYSEEEKTQKIFINGSHDRTGSNKSRFVGNEDKLKIGSSLGGSYFQGCIADVRIWNKVRTPEEIKNSMYLQLTGKELGLLGYWRLDAIVEGKERKVIDFSVNGNDGIVQGGAYVSSVTLKRNLEGTQTAVIKATKYENEDLFAVSERATYTEEFEFKTDNNFHPTTGSSNIFSLTYKGKKSQRSQNWITITAKATEFTSLDNNWYKASSSFTVPDGVSMVRSFGISEINGNWATLEIRKHKIQLTSDSITEVKYTDTIANLTTLADSQIQLQESVKTLEIQEVEEAVMFKEKRNLDAQIKFLEVFTQEQARELKEREVATQQVIVNSYTSLRDYWKTELERVELQVTLYEHPDFQGTSLTRSVGTHVIGNISGNWNWNDRVSSVRVPPGLKVTLYEHGINDSGRTKVLTADINNLYSSNESQNFNDLTSSIKVETLAGNTDRAFVQTKLTEFQSNLSSAQATLTTLLGELADINGSASSRNARLADLKKRLGVVETELNLIQTALNTSNNTVIEGVKNIQQTPQTMRSLNSDSRGLVTQGALLGFVRPASRLSAIETCEGNVQLSYFDDRGRMRLTNFDAAADSSKNTTFEQWIPDSVRTCLNFNNNSSLVTLERAVYLDEEWTIEAWFAYPLPVPKPTSTYNSLVRGKETNNPVPIIVKKGDNSDLLGIAIEGGHFKSSGYDLTSLSPGWHHLTAVAQGDTTLFYIDGEKVGDTKATAIAEAEEKLNETPNDANKKRELEDIKRAILKVTSNVKYIGNIQSGKEQFGKIAELRIWGIALSAEEVAVNSKTLLTGNEPGLLAYYPLTEATDITVDNKTGDGNNGEITGASWWGCAAPIGKLVEAEAEVEVDRVMHFSDSGAVKIEKNIDSSAFTISFWAKILKTPIYAGESVLYFSRNNRVYTQIIIFSQPNNTIGLQLEISELGGLRQTLLVPTVAFRTWMHICVTYDGSSCQLYLNGEQFGDGIVQSGNTTNNFFSIFIGNGNSGSFDGCVAEFCFWLRVRSEAEIKADMNQRLTGKEEGLAVYLPLDSIESEGSKRQVLDLTPNGTHGTVQQQAKLVKDENFPLTRVPSVASVALVSNNALVSCEYSTISKDRSAIMRRFFAAPTAQGVELLPDKRIEELELKWIGNGQFAPTLLGYIEGAPPIPSENLTIDEGYHAATSVELALSEDVEFSWKRIQDSGLGSTIDTFIGANAEADAGFGFTTKISEIKSGFKGDLETSYQFQNESSITSSSSLSMTDTIKLCGTQEQDANFPHLGKRFIPKNVGYALVVSALSDVFITRLKRSGKMIGYQVLPVENMPPDINTITFLINPAYTMSGSLDGLTGSSATSQHFFKHVPEMRSQFGSLYPASYYRLQEAYDLKQQIDQQDKNREAYFCQFNTLLVDETSLNSQTYKGNAPGETSLNRPDNKPEENLTPEEQQAQAAAQQAQLEEETGAAFDQQSTAVKQKQAEIEQKIKDEEKRSQASASFAGWQKKMEDIQIRAGKRNIVNTYVWDADGGLRAEAQSFANTAEHSIGGAFNMVAGLGAQGEFGVFGFGAELTAQATVNLTQTMTKTEKRSKGIRNCSTPLTRERDRH